MTQCAPEVPPTTECSVSYLVGDCLDFLWDMPGNSVDLVICSPPYEAQRTYGVGFDKRGQEWVDWAAVRYLECVRVCRGLVCWVVEGSTRKFEYSATPLLLAADLHRLGVKLRKPPVFHRSGIPGSGGPDWLRNDYEFCLCASKGKLPWSDNTVMGHPPKYGVGGAMSYRHKDGQRRNQAMGNPLVGPRVPDYVPPAKANPGNVIHCVVGGGLMGHDLAHENEAPFPESLAEFFIRSFCPPGGVVLDPFAGSGTTLCVAKQWGRKSVGIDCRESQRLIAERRWADPKYTPQSEGA